MCAALMCKPDTITACDAHHLCKHYYKDSPVFMDWPFNWPLIGPEARTVRTVRHNQTAVESTGAEAGD